MVLGKRLSHVTIWLRRILRPQHRVASTNLARCDAREKNKVQNLVFKRGKRANDITLSLSPFFAYSPVVAPPQDDAYLLSRTTHIGSISSLFATPRSENGIEHLPSDVSAGDKILPLGRDKLKGYCVMRRHCRLGCGVSLHLS